MYILDPNTPLDILRNEMMTKTTPSPSKAQEPPSSSSSSSANIKIPLQPRVYQNKYLTPSLPIYYETIPNQRFYVHPRQHEANPTTEWKSEENSNSVTTFTVNLSPNHSIHEEYPADIDLESIEEKRKLSSAAGGGGGGKRQEVDEIPKTEVQYKTHHLIQSSSGYIGWS